VKPQYTLGRIYSKLQRYGEALNFFEKTHDYYTDAGDKEGLAGSLYNIGIILRAR